ncbi:MAG: HAMP domain-containing protein [Sedimentisphaerales bacterium]|nr:HAMP domain-containing protein [Sedimentisphaerales bacterium]
MSLMQNMAIRHKLIGITMLTCVASLTLAGAAFIAWEWRSLRAYAARDLSIQAEMVAENCRASVAFEDAEDAKRVLVAMHVEPSILFAGIYTKNGDEFASYYAGHADLSIQPPRIHGDGYSFADGRLTVFKRILLDGEIIGTVSMCSDLAPIHRTLMRTIRITGAVLLFAVLIAYIVSSRLQKVISEPILKLADVAKEVSEEEDYSHRAVKRCNDEVGLLIDAFNKMLEQIQKRDWELVQAKTELETRVRQRTSELSSANSRLEDEIRIRKEIQAKQHQILAKLQIANKDLSDFAYIVSHDLKAPLRGIKTLTEWIIADYADKIDDQGREQMNLLSNRVDRMHNLIEGILQYSRVGRVKEDLAVVDLNEAVAEVVDLIAPPGNISITTDNELPTITCEPTRIRQVFQNLLSNAVKYMDKPQGKISIACVEDDDYWKFSVTDNGPGIEEKYFEKIFQMFQTLSARDEFESTGVGLTVVKKIVEMYGGKIWVQSVPGEGSTFLFIFPKQETEAINAQRQTYTAC